MIYIDCPWIACVILIHETYHVSILTFLVTDLKYVVTALPSIGNKGKVRCSMEGKPPMKESNSNMGMSAALAAATLAATMSSPAAMALVDDRLSTEGTGLPFGLSNNLLGWILLGVFALIWALYFTYASSLEEDEESGLSL
jgi:photosystem II PsbW protein